MEIKSNETYQKEDVKDLKAVKCPKCQIVFYKNLKEVDKEGICPVCNERVIFEIQKNGKDTNSTQSAE